MGEPSIAVHPSGWFEDGPLRTYVYENGGGIVMVNIPTMRSYLSEISLGCASDYEMSPSTFGLAHVLEHLKCKPTRNFDRWDAFAGAFQNASTNQARTDFYALLPGSALKQSIDVYVDQQCGNRVTQEHLDQEIHAVLNELERSQVNPMRQINGRLHALANVNTHARYHETIGFRQSITGASVDDLNAFADDYYTMDRACLVLVGDFSDEEFRRGIVDHLDTTWGAIPATTCKLTRTKFDETPNMAPGCREEIMLVGDPGFNFLGTCVHAPRANDTVSIHNELIAETMNGPDGVLHALVDANVVQCIEANAERSMASQPLFELLMNCKVDTQQARTALMGLLARPASEAQFKAAHTRLLDEYTSALSDVSKVAETLPSMLAYDERCGALAAHDMVARCGVLSGTTYSQFQSAWEALAMAFVRRSFTLHARSGNMAPQIPHVASPVPWGVADAAWSKKLCPQKMEWDIPKLQRQLHPILVKSAQTNNVHICARLAANSIPYFIYLKQLAQQTSPSSVRCDVAQSGDCINCTCTMDWEHLTSGSRWFVNLIRSEVSPTIVPQVRFNVQNTYHTQPQMAVDFEATSMLYATPKSLDVGESTLQNVRRKMLNQPLEVSLYLPNHVLHVSPNMTGALSQMTHTFRACRLRLPGTRPQFTHTLPTHAADSTVPLKSSISVCSMILPCASMDVSDLAVLSCLNAAFGGDFRSMLMRHVRLEMGLTYSTHSSLKLATSEAPMHILLTASFAPENYEAGRAAMNDVVRAFQCIPEETFEFGQRMVEMRLASLSDVPSYNVGHQQFLLHLGVGEDEWGDHISKATYADAMRVLSEHVQFDAMVTATSTAA